MINRLFLGRLDELFDGISSDKQIKEKLTFFDCYFNSHLTKDEKEALLSEMEIMIKENYEDVLRLFCSVLELFKRNEYPVGQRREVEIKEAVECIELTKKIQGYQIISRIGEGSGRVVYKAWDETDECYVAIKVAKKEEQPESSNRRKQVEKYGTKGLAEKEAHAARKLTHRNLVRYFGRGVVDGNAFGRPYIVEEYVEGRTLEKEIQHGIKERTAGLFIMDVLEATAYLHACGFVHRDIKPANILCTKTGAVLGDLELVKCVEERKQNEDLLASRILTVREQLTEMIVSPGINSGIPRMVPLFVGKHTFITEQGVHGSRLYTAPEVIFEGKLSYAADIFSIGIIMYEIFCQEHPFSDGKDSKVNRGNTIANISNEHFYHGLQRKIQRNEEIPKTYKKIIMSCLKYDPRERDINAGMVLDEVKKAYRKEFDPSYTKPLIFTAALIGILALYSYYVS